MSFQRSPNRRQYPCRTLAYLQWWVHTGETPNLRMTLLARYLRREDNQGNRRECTLHQCICYRFQSE